MYVNKEQIILASSSPRRQQMLADMGLHFSVHAAEIDETAMSGETGRAFVMRMAADKARAVGCVYRDKWVVAGDTVVILGDEILGKPRDCGDAVKMLMKLSGRSHYVLSAIALHRHLDQRSFIEVARSKVEFFPFAEDVARAYVATGEPLDKAGSYGIQGKGAVLVHSISGSYTNIVGMPLGELVELLVREGVIAVRSV